MPAYAQVKVELKDAALAAMLALLDDGKVEIRTGAGAGIENAASGSVLSTHQLDNPAFDAPSGGEATMAAVSDVTATGSGTAGHARFYQSDDSTGGIECSVGGSNPMTAVNTTSEVITLLAAHGWSADTEVELFLEPAGVLPTSTPQVAERTSYYIRSPSGADTQLAATPGGAAINFTAAGSGWRLKLASTAIALSSVDGSVAAGNTVSILDVAIRFVP